MRPPSAPKSKPTNSQSTRRFKMGNVSSIKQRLMLLPLVLLLAACSSPPTTLPTCSNALTNERAIWLRLLTKPEPGD